MTVPSAINFKFKFPEFVSVPDPSIEFALEEAGINCGETSGDNWLDEDTHTLACYLYAAHLLQSAIQRARSGTGQILQSESIGELSKSYAVQSGGVAGGDFNTTMYGVRYKRLLTANFPTVTLVNSGVRM